MKNKGEKISQAVMPGVTSALFVFPLYAAMGACTGAGMNSGMIGAAIASALGAFSGGMSPQAVYLFIIFSSAQAVSGTGLAMASVCAAGVITTVLAFAPAERLKKVLVTPETAGLGAAAAFLVTAMQTNNYFGIGASGDDALTMIRSYLSLGFHPNWRGVLYGTIVLVVMITFPKKFKSLSKKLPASFIAVAVTLVLNLFLNPAAETTAISEAGAYSFAAGSLLQNALFPDFRISLFYGIVYAVIIALVFAGMLTSYLIEDGSGGKRAGLAAGIGNILSGALGGVPVAVNTERWSPLSGAVGAGLTLVLFAAMKPITARIPLPALAVVLIMTAWQNVGWRRVKHMLTYDITLCIFCIILWVIMFVKGPLLAVAGAVYHGRSGKQVNESTED
ncbi:MAG: hypothetical protein FWF05_01380 [Oscillospiraceae bacterium]|nr:hypothetical protein [Oscillospiraceae bacterium]